MLMNLNIKRERFVRIATARTNKILNNIKILGNCSNLNAYEYSEDEIKKIFIEIEKQLKETKNKFDFKKRKEFKL